MAESRPMPLGLGATVLYYRPADRSKVLRSLVSLGMFVTEVDCAADGTAWTLRHTEDDLVVAFVEDSDAHRQVVGVVAQQFRATLAVLPECDSLDNSADFPADEVIRERGSQFEHIERCISKVGLLARSRSQGRAEMPKSDVTVFGGLRFRSSHRWLEHEDRVVGLSPTEHGVLLALVSAHGRLVPKDLLLRQLSGSLEPASEGYLKTVVLRIRRKAERLGGDSTLLSSIRGLGYLLSI